MEKIILPILTTDTSINNTRLMVPTEPSRHPLGVEEMVLERGTPGCSVLKGHAPDRIINQARE